jgi:glycosyltransferase involved in cell wall biosynthesis
MSAGDTLVEGEGVQSATARPAAVEIIVPVYNEAEGLEQAIRRLHGFLQDFPLTWQITVADNASTDGTLAIAQDLAAELSGIGVLHLEQKGRGRALRAAWLASESPVVSYMDVDLSTELDALLPLVAPLVSGHSDVAIGTRLAHGARVVRGPKREVISRGYNLLLRAALRSGFTDAQCGFKAIRTDVARVLLPLVEDEGWFFDTELLVLAEHNGLRIHEVPVDWVDDPDSRVDVIRTAKGDLQGIWRMVKRLARGSLHVHPLGDRTRVEPSLAGQIVRFGSIGILSTALFSLLFHVMAGPIGAVSAGIIAMLLCSLGNTAANRRLTFALRGRTDLVRHHLRGLLVNLLPLTLTTGTLVALDLVGSANRSVQLVSVTAANAGATVARFVLLRIWVFRPAR